MSLDAIKLDMGKTYDKVELGFLEKIMTIMGFHGRCVQLIMKWVTFVSYKINVTGSFTSRIVPQCVLR